jgi:hypothetical protein
VSTLYPRLLPGETDRLFKAMQGRSPKDLEAIASVSSGRAVFAATGGTRTTRDELRLLATELEKMASAVGYPEAPNVNARTDFDRAVGEHLHQHSGMTPGEASQRQVWAFLALVLVPHLCAWRFPMRDGAYQADRFKGSDLTRHALGRLWTRAHVLHEPSAADPYSLMAGMGEADFDQVMARRRAVSATPGLVRAVVRAHMEDSSSGDDVSAREVLRDTLQRLLRLTAFLDLDWMSDSQLLDLVREQRTEARRHLRMRVSSG